MNLSDIIALREAAVRAVDPPTPISRTAALTERGHAAQALYRLLHILRALDAADRSAILGLLKRELEGDRS